MAFYGAGPAGGKGGGFIPPPPDAHFDSGGDYKPFPGATQSNHATVASSWLAPPSPSPWASDWPYAGPRNWSPYSHPPFGQLSPAPQVLNMPGGGGYHTPGLGQPIAASPWFNPGALHEEWPSHGGWNVGYESPLKRTHSHDPPPYSPWHYSAGYPLTRSLSSGSGKRVGNYNEYDSEYLAKRPRDYRKGFESRWNPLSIRVSIQKLRSEVPEFKDPIKRTVNELLQYKRPVTDILLIKQSDIYISYDLRYPPNPEVLTFPYLRRPPNNIDLAQLATHPAAEHMQLIHPLLPWYIDVQQGQANGITVYDVLVQMFDQLHQPIIPQHFWNEELNSADRERISRAFELRTEGCKEERDMGIRKVDYLGDKVTFIGLVRTMDKRWEMKTK